MRSHRTLQIAGAVLMLAMSASAAHAQTVRVKVGDTLWRTDSAHRTAGGVVVDVSPSALTVASGGREQQWTLADTAELWREGDSLKNGLMIGALAGLGAGLFGGIGMASIAEAEDPSSYMLGTGVLGAAVGAGIGGLIDALHRGRTLVYSQPVPKVVVSPLVSRDRRGAQIAVRF